MKNAILYITTIIFTLVLSACKKEKVDPLVENKPVFTANINFDGENSLIEAGVHDAFMFTSSENFNNVLRFVGKLGTSEEYLEIKVFDGMLDVISNNTLENLVNEVNFIHENNHGSVTINKDDFINASNIEFINWKKDGQQFATNNLVLNEAGIYDICAEFHFLDGEVVTTCNEIIVGFKHSVGGHINHFVGLDNILNAWIEEETQTISSVQWELDGNIVSINNNLNINVSDDQHVVKATILYANGVTKTRTINIDANEEGKMIEDFSKFENMTSNETFWDFGLEVNYFKNGTLYSSSKAQNGNSTLQITNVKYFGKNANGKDVYQFNATISSNLSVSTSSNSEAIEISTTFGLEINP